MKKFFLLAIAAATVLSSCSKNSISDNNSEANQIGFYSYTGRATKAGSSFVTSGTLPANSKFGVYCYNTGASSFSPTSNTANFMANVDVSYNGTGNTASNYSYSPARYWPSDGANHLLTFFAYYPFTDASGSTTGITAKPDANTAGLGSYTFVVPSSSADQIDFMISDAVKDQQYTTNTTNNGEVDLSFHHMLTQVNFQAKTAADYTGTTVIIKSVTISNVNSQGVLSVASDAASSMWTPSNPSNFTVPVSTSSSDATLNTTAKDFTSNNQTSTLLMMPQSIPANAKLVVTYSYQTTGMTEAITDTKEVALSTSSVLSWTKNQNILYTISVGLNAITFTATVKDWDNVTTQEL